jgi:hypothetical protein
MVRLVPPFSLAQAFTPGLVSIRAATAESGQPSPLPGGFSRSLPFFPSRERLGYSGLRSDGTRRVRSADRPNRDGGHESGRRPRSTPKTTVRRADPTKANVCDADENRCREKKIQGSPFPKLTHQLASDRTQSRLESSKRRAGPPGVTSDQRGLGTGRPAD